MLMTQLPPGATLVPQVFWETLKSPETVMEFIVRVIELWFVSVIGLTGLVVFTTRGGKLRAGGENDTSVPVPAKLTIWGLPAPSSVTVRVPLRSPVTVGVKVTLMVQVCCAGSVCGHVVCDWKSPLATTEDKWSEFGSKLVSLTLCTGLGVFTF